MPWVADTCRRLAPVIALDRPPKWEFNLGAAPAGSYMPPFGMYAIMAKEEVRSVPST
jgi:hypothetical protein